MNAHQRRTERRKPRFVFDIETFPVGGFVPADLTFSLASVRPTGGRQATTMRILKERTPTSGSSEFVFSPDGLGDFTKLEDRIIAYGGGKGGGKGIDCHRLRAAGMFNVAYEAVTDEQRAAGKDANYLSWWKV